MFELFVPFNATIIIVLSQTKASENGKRSRSRVQSYGVESQLMLHVSHVFLVEWIMVEEFPTAKFVHTDEQTTGEHPVCVWCASNKVSIISITNHTQNNWKANPQTYRKQTWCNLNQKWSGESWWRRQLRGICFWSFSVSGINLNVCSNFRKTFAYPSRLS